MLPWPLAPWSVNNNFGCLCNSWDYLWHCTCTSWSTPLVTGYFVWLSWLCYVRMCYGYIQFSSIQSLSRVQLFATPWTAACQASLSITNSRSLLKSCPLSRWCHPTISSSVIPFSSCLQSVPASGKESVLSNESVLRINWTKCWSFSFSISPSNKYSGLISFRMDWLDLLAVQGTLKSLLQHDSLKASILWHSAFIIVQLSHPYMTTGKTIALTRQTFVGNVSAF